MSEEPQIHQYTEDDFETLNGIYVLFKEIVDNAIDEYIMGYGKVIDITLQDNMVTVRDYGRGIPFGKLTEAVSKMNTGAKYGSAAFKKSVGLNGVGTKAVNATSTYFYIQSFRDGESRFASFSKGDLVEEGRDLGVDSLLVHLGEPVFDGMLYLVRPRGVGHPLDA